MFNVLFIHYAKQKKQDVVPTNEVWRRETCARSACLLIFSILASVWDKEFYRSKTALRLTDLGIIWRVSKNWMPYLACWCGRGPTVLLALIPSLAIQSITSLCCFFVFVRSFCSGCHWRSSGSWRGPWALLDWFLFCFLRLSCRRHWFYSSGASIFFTWRNI